MVKEAAKQCVVTLSDQSKVNYPYPIYMQLTSYINKGATGFVAVGTTRELYINLAQVYSIDWQYV